MLRVCAIDLAPFLFSLFFFTATATTEIYTLSLHDALPISSIVLGPSGGLHLVLGSPGGSRIPTAVYQVISDMIDQEMPLSSAIGAPRLHHQAVPDTLHLERDGFVQAVIDSLEVMGHTVGVWNYKTEVNAIARAAAGWVGVADPRRGGGAAGY